MKKNVPDSEVGPGHRDFTLLRSIESELDRRAGGRTQLTEKFTAMLRKCVDDVIMTPKTGRRSYEELEKTEKTYIGTRVEIELRAMLKLPKGRLDTEILGHDVDIKNTMLSNWEIPGEALCCPLILVAADEAQALCYLGLVVAHPEYLRDGKNQDSKRSLKASEWRNILWLIRDEPYPKNFWRTVEPSIVTQIFEGKSGNERVKRLFRLLQKTPISREVINAVAKQKDFTRRVRADKTNKSKGTRDQLLNEGVLLLSSEYGGPLISALSLPNCLEGEYISHQVTTQAEVEIARRHGIHVALATKADN